MADDLAIRQRILARTLPASPRAFIYVRNGDGSACGCCDAPIGRSVNIIYVDDERVVVPMHGDCFREWHAIAVKLALPVELTRASTEPLGANGRAGDEPHDV